MGDYFDNLLLTLIKVLWTVKPYSPKFFTISAIILQIFQNQKSLTNYVNKNELRSDYDYIVIGAGSAGSVMASRLSEDPANTVLLLEAGMPENIITLIPRSAFMLHETPIDWAYLTEPQNNSCWGIRSRRSRFSKGKLMGGCSSINLMAVSRGNPRDYDKWKADGCVGWGWADLFPYFIKSEDNQDHRMVATGYHGKGGPMAVSTQGFVERISYAFRDAAPYLNMTIGDPLGPTQNVFTIHQRSELNGERMSAARAYLQSLPELRSNLDIFTKAFVTKIIFDETKRAVGIRAVINGEKKEINVTKEIVLSAGTIQSPQLLMLSGVGHAEHLKWFGIPVVSDLPVGDNLQEHVSSTIMFTLNDTVSGDVKRDLNPQNILQYFSDKKGSMTSSFAEAMAFVKTKYANQSDDWPDMQIHAMPGSLASDYGLRLKQIFGLSEELWETFRPYAGAHALMLNTILLRPRSRGWVRLQSTDPSQHPLIDPKFFSNEYDLDVLVEGLKIALQIGQTPPLQAYGAWPITRKYPGCENYKLYSDQYLRCMAQTLTLHPYHAVGTCKMGPTGDRTAVVDLDLKVKGVTGLRVVDASVIPNHISGNTNIPVIAIAEKIADQMSGRRLRPMLPPMERTFVFKLPNLPYDNITVEDNNETKANSSETKMV